jgi:hypothetical protein
MEDFYGMLYFWRMVVAYLALLGVQLSLLGVAVGGWEMARKRRAQRELATSGRRKVASPQTRSKG